MNLAVFRRNLTPDPSGNRVAIKPAFVVFLLLMVWRSLLECPRCHQTFNAWYGNEEDRFRLSGRCQHCGLTQNQIRRIAQQR